MLFLVSLQNSPSLFLRPLHLPPSPGDLSDLHAHDGLPDLSEERGPAYIQRTRGKEGILTCT